MCLKNFSVIIYEPFPKELENAFNITIKVPEISNHN